jgi:hypothetical protein
MSKKTAYGAQEVQEVTQIVDLVPGPSFEIMEKFEITKREERTNKVVRKKKKRERSRHLCCSFCPLQSF